MNKIACTATYRFNGKINIPPRRHHNDRQLRIDLLDPRNQVKPFPSGGRIPRIVQVDQQSIEAVTRQCFEHQRRRSNNLQRIAFRLQQQLQRLQNMRLIIRN